MEIGFYNNLTHDNKNDTDNDGDEYNDDYDIY